jgi:hypothetical protein
MFRDPGPEVLGSRSGRQMSPSSHCIDKSMNGHHTMLDNLYMSKSSFICYNLLFSINFFLHSPNVVEVLMMNY